MKGSKYIQFTGMDQQQECRIIARHFYSGLKSNYKIMDEQIVLSRKA